MGDAIPLLARIISVVDAYNAMTTTRPYREGMPVSRACEILEENRGPQWDGEIVECFLGLLNADSTRSPARHRASGRLQRSTLDTVSQTGA